MGEKKTRRGRAGGPPRASTGSAPALDPQRVSDAIEAAVPSGAAHLRRDLDAWRLAHMVANSDQKAGCCYAAFQALSACAARAVHDVDGKRLKRGEPPIQDFAREMPGAVVQVPAWALVAMAEGWGRAASPRPVPVVQAFGLGGDGGDRTVAHKQHTFGRDVRIALAVAELLDAGRASSAHQAQLAVAEAHGVTPSVAYAAWVAHAKPAQRFIADRRFAGFLESGQLTEKK